MGKVLEKLISDWRSSDLTRSPYLFVRDVPVYERYASDRFCHYSTLRDYAESNEFCAPRETKFHVGLYPQPYFGNLKTASIFMLMLNPGLHGSDYYAEENCPEYRVALRANLCQENGDSDYPFFFLDPQFAWHSGFEYFHSRFRKVLQSLKVKSKLSYIQALRHLARNLACLQLVPYHSKAFGASSLIRSLQSSQAILAYAQQELVHKAVKGEVYMLVLRRAKNWGLSDAERTVENVSVYERHETRSAYLKEEDTHKIVEWLMQRI
jgi:hypothetical protein